ncbi:hypothetical protein D3C77_571830 [compost metagenome]
MGTARRIRLTARTPFSAVDEFAAIYECSKLHGHPYAAARARHAWLHLAVQGQNQPDDAARHGHSGRRLHLHWLGRLPSVGISSVRGYPLAAGHADDIHQYAGCPAPAQGSGCPAV